MEYIAIYILYCYVNNEVYEMESLPNLLILRIDGRSTVTACNMVRSIVSILSRLLFNNSG